MQYVKTSASFSDGEVYRYSLSRTWDEDKKPCIFVGLNPSTADASKDDPTFRRCVGYAQREGFGGLVMLNIFAYRATNPNELYEVEDPIGRFNQDAFMEEIQLLNTDYDREPKGALVVCAWGGHGTLMNQGEHALGWIEKELWTHIKGYRIACLGINLNHTPSHPLYLKKDAPLRDYMGQFGRYRP